MLAFLAALFAPLALAAPLADSADLAARAASPPAWCAGLGGSWSDMSKKNFTLGALSYDGPRKNATGDPLVLGQAGAIPGASFHILSTYNSYPYNDFPSLYLREGRLYANNQYGTPTYSTKVTSGSQPGFVTTSQPMDQPPQQYCIVSVPNSKRSVLAVNNKADKFSLCKNGDAPLTQNNVVFEATYPPATGTTCTRVLLTVIPA